MAENIKIGPRTKKILEWVEQYGKARQVLGARREYGMEYPIIRAKKTAKTMLKKIEEKISKLEAQACKEVRGDDNLGK